MKTSVGLKSLVAAVGCLALLSYCGAVYGQATPANPGHKALARPIHYSTPLSSKDSAHAVIVYGKDALWTHKAAKAVQKSIEDWSGVKLDIVDDRTATSEDTWLLNDAYRKTPLIVLGNAQDNRIMHALGTRYLLQSNRTWPGGDRYIVRTVFEPFSADVNYIVLEVSTEAGMDGATAKFAELLKRFPKSEAAGVPHTRVVGSTKDKWQQKASHWKLPPEWESLSSSSAAELALAFKGKPNLAGWDSTRGADFIGEITTYMQGGAQWGRQEDPIDLSIDLAHQRGIAAMCLLGVRAIGGRAFQGYDHYGTTPYIVGLRAVMQSGVLTEKEFNELESALTLCAIHPDHYPYEALASGEKLIRNRHSKACMMNAVINLDYVATHCRMDEETRKEVQRRYEGTHKTVGQYVRSFRDPCEDSCMGETALLQIYSLIHQGFMDVVRNGMLRRAADMYILTTDNIECGWSCGCYPGLAGFTSAPGGMTKGWLGGSLVMAAAFYYDDPQYRWLVRNRNLPQGSEAAGGLGMHSPYDAVGQVELPARYYGVCALPCDERIHGLLEDRELLKSGGIEGRLAPEPLAKSIDRVAFRDGFEPNDAYLLLATSEDIPTRYPAQNNTIARFTDLGDIWLYTNTTDGTTWSRSAVCVSNGKGFVPRAGCTLEAMMNQGDLSAVSSKEQGVGGADCTRTIVHWRGHYFVVLDRMEAQADDEFNFVCRWRSTQSAALAGGVWTASAPSGNTMRIQNAEPLFQTSEYWEIDGSGRPYVLEQHKQARLAKGEVRIFQNLLYVSGEQRPDEFEGRRVSPEAMLVKGKTKEGEHLALIGVGFVGAKFPLAEFEADAAIYDLSGNTMHLAGVTTLRAKVGDAMKEVFHSAIPANLLVDCESGKAVVQVPGEKPGDLRIRESLPKLTELLAALWTQSKPTAAYEPPAKKIEPVFEAKVSAQPFQRPLPRINNVFSTSAPPPGGQRGAARIWSSTDNLEIVQTFPQSTDIGCLRLVGMAKRAESSFSAKKAYAGGDFKFTLILSDDGFQKDLRKIDNPEVTFEETAQIGIGHSSMYRLPTWRIQVQGKARQLKLLPRSMDKNNSSLCMNDLEVYGDRPNGVLSARALIADIDSDGSNELIVSTSQREIAAYDADGKRLWNKALDGDVLLMDVADLDDNGKMEAIAYLTSEKLLRINGDGTERLGGDIHKAFAQVKPGSAVALGAMATWASGGPGKKEVWLWGEPSCRVLADGTVKLLASVSPNAAGRVSNLLPNEPEALAMVGSETLSLLSARCDKDGKNVALGGKHLTGFNGSTAASGTYFGFSCVQPVDAGEFKGIVAAIGGGVNWYPVSAFAPGSKEEGWSFNTGGPNVTGVLVEDVNGDGVPELLLAREDGFVSVFKLSDGSLLGQLNTGQSVRGMAVLKDKLGKPCLAVGNKLGVYLFGNDPSGAKFKTIGSYPLPVAAFAGPGGKNKDRVFVVGSSGNITILTLK